MFHHRKQDKNNSSDSFELDLSNIDDETEFDSEVPDDDELDDPKEYFKNTSKNKLINCIKYKVMNIDGRSVGKIREMKVKFHRFVSLMNKINADLKSKGSQFLQLR